MKEPIPENILKNTIRILTLKSPTHKIQNGEASVNTTNEMTKQKMGNDRKCDEQERKLPSLIKGVLFKHKH